MGEILNCSIEKNKNIISIVLRTKLWFREKIVNLTYLLESARLVSMTNSKDVTIKLEMIKAFIAK